MLLRIIPMTAIALTVATLLSTNAWRPDHKDGLYAPAHQTSGLF